MIQTAWIITNSSICAVSWVHHLSYAHSKPSCAPIPRIKSSSLEYLPIHAFRSGGRSGGGLATFIPSFVSTTRVAKTDFMLYTCLASLHFPALHLINIYLPPGYCNFSSAQQNAFWLDISQLLTTLPSAEPLLIVGNFNAYLGDSFYSLHPLCPCHGAKCIPLQGTTSGPTAARGG